MGWGGLLALVELEEGAELAVTKLLAERRQNPHQVVPRVANQRAQTLLVKLVFAHQTNDGRHARKPVHLLQTHRAFVRITNFEGDEIGNGGHCLFYTKGYRSFFNSNFLLKDGHGGKVV